MLRWKWLPAAVAALGIVGPAAPSAATPITNGSFETRDFSGWVTQDLTNPFMLLMVATAGLYPGFGLFTSAPTDGRYAAFHGFDGEGPGTIRIAQDFSVTPGRSQVSFDWRAGWDLVTFCEGCTGDRFFEVNVERAGGGANLFSTRLLTAGAGTVHLDTGPMRSSVDLAAFAGDTVRLSFDFFIPENFTGPAFFQLDNVAPIPEPSAALLSACGLLWVGVSGRRYPRLWNRPLRRPHQSGF